MESTWFPWTIVAEASESFLSPAPCAATEYAAVPPHASQPASPKVRCAVAVEAVDEFREPDVRQGLAAKARGSVPASSSRRPLSRGVPGEVGRHRFSWFSLRTRGSCILDLGPSAIAVIGLAGWAGWLRRIRPTRGPICARVASRSIIEKVLLVHACPREAPMHHLPGSASVRQALRGALVAFSHERRVEAAAGSQRGLHFTTGPQCQP